MRSTASGGSARRQRELSLDDSDDSPGVGAVREPRATEPDPERLMLLANASQLIRADVDSLPAQLREVLVLREMEGLSYRSIAAVTEVPIGTVMFARAARQRLRDFLVERGLARGRAMSCDTTAERISAYLDDALDRSDADAFERHLETCADCARKLANLRALRSDCPRRTPARAECRPGTGPAPSAQAAGVEPLTPAGSAPAGSNSLISIRRQLLALAAASCSRRSRSGWGGGRRGAPRGARSWSR